MCACEVCLSVVCLPGSFYFQSISTEIFLHCAVIVFSQSAYVCLVHCVYFCVVCSCAVCVSVVRLCGRCNCFSISTEISLQCPFMVFSQSAHVCIGHSVYFCVLCLCAVCRSFVCLCVSCYFWSISTEISVQRAVIVFIQSVYVCICWSVYFCVVCLSAVCVSVVCLFVR